MFLIKFWTFLSLFLLIFILSLSVLFFKTSHYTYFRMFDVVPQVSEARSLFSLFSNWIIYIIDLSSSSVIISHDILNLLFNTSRGVFISVIVLFKSIVSL